MSEDSLPFWMLVLAILILIYALVRWANKKRRERLLAKYGDPKDLEKIMSKKIWQGMTKEQLIDSWGHPVDQAQKVFKTKVRETFKYNQIGRNRFKSKVMLEGDIVVGWEL